MNAIERLQTDIGGRLDSAAEFFYVGVFVVRPRSENEATVIKTRIDQLLAGVAKKNGKAGVTALVQMPVLDVSKPNMPGPFFDLTATVRVIENPLVSFSASGAGLSAEDVMLDVLSLLHNFTPGGTSRNLFADNRAAEPIETYLKEGKIAWDVMIHTHAGIANQTRAAAPVIEGSAPAVSLTTATAGAAIYYTSDASYPYQGNTAAALYSAPFAVEPGAMVRAGAYLEGLQPSDISALLFAA